MYSAKDSLRGFGMNYTRLVDMGMGLYQVAMGAMLVILWLKPH